MPAIGQMQRTPVKNPYPITNPYKVQLPGQIQTVMPYRESGGGGPIQTVMPYRESGGISQQPTPKLPNVPSTNTVGNPYDVSGDPILQQVLGNNVRTLNQAAAQRTEDQKKLLLGFGSSELAKKMFGGDQSFVDSVAGNPFSVLGQIAHQYEGRGGQINQANENLNQNNLFYSSERTGNVLPELYRQRQSSEYDATQNVQNALDQISQAYTGVQNQNAQNEISARQDAANRATQAALQSGYGPGASNTTTLAPTSNPGLTDPFANPTNPGYKPGTTVASLYNPNTFRNIRA